MATGVPKKDARRVDKPVRIDYEGKQPVQNIIEQQPQNFAPCNAGPLDKRLYFGDNLDVLQHLLWDPTINGKVTLVYIDPPFATESTYLSRTQREAYVDALTGAEYVEFLRKRLVLLRELLSHRGSIYVHLDEKMVFAIKMIMDEVFGSQNYRNLIVRKKCNPKNYTRKAYGNIADFILFYTKRDDYVWNRPIEPLSEQGMTEYQYVESETGRRFMKVPVHAPGTRRGATGQPWRGKMPPPGKHWQYPPSTLDEMDARGEIFWSKNGNPRRKIYLDEHPGVGVQDIWLDFRDAHNQNIRISGYPTEKNPDLLRRIIAASSNPGDMVLDCFAGSGTTLAVADELQRNWIGADNSIEALRTMLNRFEQGLQPMGDYVNGNRNAKKAAQQPTLFDTLDVRAPSRKTSERKPHRSITEFTIFLPDDSPLTVKALVREWLGRNNLPSASHGRQQFAIAEDADFAAICYHLHSRDSKLAKIIDAVGPCGLTVTHSGIEFLIDAIISQQLSKTAADTILKRVRGLFPSKSINAEAFLNIPKKALRKAGLSDQKYAYITDLCQRVSAGELNIDELQCLPDDVIRNRLKNVKGIGDWTVDMYLLFGLARLDVFPIRDLALRKAISRVYGTSQDDVERMKRIAQRWEPYRSLVSTCIS